MVKTFCVKTYGCQMNHSDSERIVSVCNSLGLKKVDDYSSADVLIFNTCSVKQAAEDRILGLGKIVGDLKATNPDLQVVITGCMVLRGSGKRQEDWSKKLHNQMPWADYFIPIKHIHTLGTHLKGIDSSIGIDEYFTIPPRYKSEHEAFVPISTGCDHYCTFCIVPFSRGREVRRDANSIIGEVNKLIEQGYKDITLLGQIVNRWENPDKGSDIQTFADLLKAIDDIKGDFWFTFLSSHPNYMTDELIDVMAKSKHGRPYFHFALQSGNDEMLRKMNRRHTIKEFYRICDTLYKRIPFLNLSTDIIVGYPGETKQHFLDTFEVMKKLKFDMAYISQFSPRSGTAGSLIKDDVPRKDKNERKRILNDTILTHTALEKNRKMVGKTFKTIVRKIEDDKLIGKTINFKDVTVPNRQNIKEGEFVDIEITHANSWGLKGEISFQ